jgi:dienelactone hydrolase
MLPLFALLFAAPLFAQSFAAGHANLVLANPTGQGSANIPATVYYPAATAGLGVPLLPRPSGHRVLVFLHGLNVLGSGYGALGTRFAQHGYVVVLGNTAQSSASLQVQDGIATFAALAQANSQPGLLQGALDMTRVGLAGHSMGGATTPGVLAANPGYRCGFCFSPGVAPAAAQVTVPMAVCHGAGDTFLDWQTFGLPLYQNLTAVQQLRSFHLMNTDCTHGNVAGFVQATQVDRDVFAATSNVALGFFACFLDGDVQGLEHVIGDAARSEPRLQQLDCEVRAPQHWAAGRPGLGQTFLLRIGTEPGPVALFTAASQASWPTPFGLALLDPGSLLVVAAGTAANDRLWSLPVAVPTDPSLVGFPLLTQGLGLGTAPTWLTTGLAITIVEP